jgi:hypothetical protein
LTHQRNRPLQEQQRSNLLWLATNKPAFSRRGIKFTAPKPTG